MEATDISCIDLTAEEIDLFRTRSRGCEVTGYKFQAGDGAPGLFHCFADGNLFWFFARFDDASNTLQQPGVKPVRGPSARAELLDQYNFLSRRDQIAARR